MNSNTIEKIKLRISHFPQVPCKAFHVDVNSIEEALKIMNVLAYYDLFSFIFYYTSNTALPSTNL